jgi:hypothetical protein
MPCNKERRRAIKARLKAKLEERKPNDAAFLAKPSLQTAKVLAKPSLLNDGMFNSTALVPYKAPADGNSSTDKIDENPENAVSEYNAQKTTRDKLTLKWQSTYKSAARANNLAALMYLNLGVKPDEENMQCMAQEVAQLGHLRILKWFKKRGVVLPNVEICIIAARARQTHVLDWIQSEGFDYEYYLMKLARCSADALLLEWASERVAARPENLAIDIAI